MRLGRSFDLAGEVFDELLGRDRLHVEALGMSLDGASKTPEPFLIHDSGCRRRCPGRSAAKVVERPTGKCLSIGGKVYALSKSKRFPFDHGELVATDQILSFGKGGRTRVSVDLKALLNDWLKDETKWGGHKAANGLRYMAGAGGGMSADLSECYEEPHGTALAVLDFHYAAPSENPLAAQSLFRVSSAPFTFKLLRRLLTPIERGEFIPPAKDFSASRAAKSIKSTSRATRSLAVAAGWAWKTQKD